MRSNVGAGGVVTLPRELCRKYGLTPGRQLIWADGGDHLIAMPVPHDTLGNFLSRPARYDEQAFLSGRRREVERENALHRRAK